MFQNKKIMVGGLLAGALLVTSASGTDWLPRQEKGVDAASVATAGTTVSVEGEPTASAASGSQTGIKIEKELTAERSRFVKQFSMTDGSFTAVAYSMPVHYKSGSKWKEINTTLVKSGKKNYKTKATDLKIKVSKKANKKSMVFLKRGKNALSIALKGKKCKASKAKISNPKKKKETDVLNQNQATYKKVLKNTSVFYDIFPEKIQEIVKINKKQKRKALSFQVNAGKLKVMLYHFS